MTFDELLKHHTCRAAIAETVAEATRLNIRSWHFVKVLRQALTETFDNGKGDFYCWPSAGANIRTWLMSNIPRSDWEMIRAPYFVAFRSIDQAMLFCIEWGSDTKRHR